ncbi:MAG: hypothetical protein QOJ24_5362 [Mycobacterium sp.]|jgi:hypothetical protein|nr:hypothetical protein [Mycobacterium sp.]
MRLRTAVALTAIVIALKVVLIGVVARGRCELIGRCGDGTAWYVGSGIAAAILLALLVVAITDVRSFAAEQTQKHPQPGV